MTRERMSSEEVWKRGDDWYEKHNLSVQSGSPLAKSGLVTKT